ELRLQAGARHDAARRAGRARQPGRGVPRVPAAAPYRPGPPRRRAAQRDPRPVGELPAQRRRGATGERRAAGGAVRGARACRARALQHYGLFHGSIAEINTDLDRYLAVSAADIRRVATKYLDPANAVIVSVRPRVAPTDSGATK